MALAREADKSTVAVSSSSAAVLRKQKVDQSSDLDDDPVELRFAIKRPKQDATPSYSLPAEKSFDDADPSLSSL